MGDNFYDHGIIGDVSCTRFQTTFEDVYTYPSLQTPWLVLAGYVLPTMMRSIENVTVLLLFITTVMLMVTLFVSKLS